MFAESRTPVGDCGPYVVWHRSVGALFGAENVPEGCVTCLL